MSFSLQVGSARGVRSGRRVLLVTASDQATADAVAGYLDLFDEAIGSDGKNNLKAAKKAEYLASRFGAGGFQYLGDSSADLPVWQAANEASMVCPSASTRRAAERQVPRTQVLCERPSKLRAAVKELRPHQWAKNTLLFVPLYFSHKYTDLSLVFTAVMAFFSFSFCASSIYVLNDLADLPSKIARNARRGGPGALKMLSELLYYHSRGGVAAQEFHRLEQDLLSPEDLRVLRGSDRQAKELLLAKWIRGSR